MLNHLYNKLRLKRKILAFILAAIILLSFFTIVSSKISNQTSAHGIPDDNITGYDNANTNATEGVVFPNENKPTQKLDNQNKPTDQPDNPNKPADKPEFPNIPNHTPTPTPTLTPTPSPTSSPTPSPTPTAQLGFEVTFANWYLNAPNQTNITASVDVDGYNTLLFFWGCDSEMQLQYSDNGETWTTQLYLTKEQCQAGGLQGFDVLGRYYRVVIGPTDLAEHFVVAQARFYY